MVCKDPTARSPDDQARHLPQTVLPHKVAHTGLELLARHITPWLGVTPGQGEQRGSPPPESPQPYLVWFLIVTGEAAGWRDAGAWWFKYASGWALADRHSTRDVTSRGCVRRGTQHEPQDRLIGTRAGARLVEACGVSETTAWRWDAPGSVVNVLTPDNALKRRTLTVRCR